VISRAHTTTIIENTTWNFSFREAKDLISELGTLTLKGGEPPTLRFQRPGGNCIMRRLSMRQMADFRSDASAVIAARDDPSLPTLGPSRLSSPFINWASLASFLATL